MVRSSLLAALFPAMSTPACSYEFGAESGPWPLDGRAADLRGAQRILLPSGQSSLYVVGGADGVPWVAFFDDTPDSHRVRLIRVGEPATEETVSAVTTKDGLLPHG